MIHRDPRPQRERRPKCRSFVGPNSRVLAPRGAAPQALSPSHRVFRQGYGDGIGRPLRTWRLRCRGMLSFVLGSPLCSSRHSLSWVAGSTRATLPITILSAIPVTKTTGATTAAAHSPRQGPPDRAVNLVAPVRQVPMPRQGAHRKSVAPATQTSRRARQLVRQVRATEPPGAEPPVRVGATRTAWLARQARARSQEGERRRNHAAIARGRPSHGRTIRLLQSECRER